MFCGRLRPIGVLASVAVLVVGPLSPRAQAQLGSDASLPSDRACPANRDGDLSRQGVGADDRLRAEAELSSALHRKGLQRFWREDAAFQIGRWHGIDRAHRIIVVQAFRARDATWSLERMVAGQLPEGDPADIKLSHANLSAQDGQQLEALLRDQCLYALPDLTPDGGPSTICLDGQEVVARFNLKDGARVVAQGCTTYGVLGQVEELIWSALPPL